MNILKHITFHLCDTNEQIVNEWKQYFDDQPNFKFYHSDIFKVPIPENDISAIISPANSFGDLQGGIDLAYYTKFGYELEGKLQKVIREHKFGELVVGDALIIDIPRKENMYLISAPTMRVPMGIKGTANAYLAFRAALIELIKFNSANKKAITHVLCPGLGTGIGKMSPEVCAKQMYHAYDVLVNPKNYLELTDLSHEHIRLVAEEDK